jgi:aminoglycoside phosphotransferase (APT) family kinase protein
MNDIVAELAGALGAVPTEIAPLGGGAGRCTMWTVEVAGRALVFRRFPDGPARDVVKHREWQVLQLARDAGVPVPEPLALTPTGIAVERLCGEADPRRLLGDERFAHARTTLVARVAVAAARLHSIEPPDDLPSEPELEGHGTGAVAAGQPAPEAAVVTLEHQLDALGEPHPALELGLRWLRLNAPPVAPRSIVHGDLRLSNLVVAEDGRAALIDWELVHAGDGAEDLGWMCMRSWRFGSPQPVLGCGPREELLAAYAAAGGRAVSLEELRWWEVCANARWGVICMLQAHRHLSGADRSLERAMIGRRTCEAEWDLLELLAEGRPPPPAAEAPQDRPDAQELLGAVAEYLRELRARTPGEDAFPLAVAANACRVVAREVGPADPVARRDAARLSGELRAGRHDARLSELLDPLRARVRAKLEVANPRWL